MAPDIREWVAATPETIVDDDGLSLSHKVTSALVRIEDRIQEYIKDHPGGYPDGEFAVTATIKVKCSDQFTRKLKTSVKTAMPSAEENFTVQTRGEHGVMMVSNTPRQERLPMEPGAKDDGVLGDVRDERAAGKGA